MIVKLLNNIYFTSVISKSYYYFNEFFQKLFDSSRISFMQKKHEQILEILNEILFIKHINFSQNCLNLLDSLQKNILLCNDSSRISFMQKKHEQISKFLIIRNKFYFI
jgi:Cdc6-like AAA superfamily ATPase